MWIRSDEDKKIRRTSADIVAEVEKFKTLGHLDEESQEKAMRLIQVAQQLKERKVAWVNTEASIKVQEVPK